MRLVLRGFSQDVDLQNPEEASSFLIFEDEETGSTARLPVAAETINSLVGLIQSMPEPDVSVGQKKEDEEVEYDEQDETPPAPRKVKPRTEEDVKPL